MAQWQTNVAGGARPIDWNNAGQSIPLTLNVLLAGEQGEKPSESFSGPVSELLTNKLAALFAEAQGKDDEIARFQRIENELAAANKSVELLQAESDELNARRKTVSLRAEPNYAAELQRLDKARNKAQAKLDDAAAARRTLQQELTTFRDGAAQRRRAMEDHALQTVRPMLSGAKQALEEKMVEALAPLLNEWLTAEFAFQQTYVNRETILASARQRLVQITNAPAALVTPETPAAEPILPPPPHLLHGQIRPPAPEPPAPPAPSTSTPPPAPWQQRILPNRDLPGCPSSAPVTTQPEATTMQAAATEPAGP